MMLFRADGAPQIGTGHIMRCLSLADAFREEGVHSVFVTAEPYMQSLIQERGYECLTLESAYDRMEDELPRLLPLLEERQPACVILDSYFVTPEYMNAIRAKAPLAYIDDLNAFDYPADVVVNYNLYGEKETYPQGKIYLLGPRYAPLRKQFQGLAPRTIKKHVKHILFSTGGTDQYHAALRCMEYLRDNPQNSNVLYHFVLGMMNQDMDRIRAVAEGLPCVRLHQQVADMRALMLRCDAAVSAAGTTLYELCACGLPAVIYILADNQIKGATAFQEAGLMPCVGDIRKEPGFTERIFFKLNELRDQDLRIEAARRMQTCVDGNGARRMAITLMELFSLSGRNKSGKSEQGVESNG